MVIGTAPLKPEEDEFLVAQFYPCGHFYNMRRSKVVALIGTNQLDDIDAGRKLDAPILPTRHCEDCQDEDERQNRLCRELDLDLFERTFG